MSSSKVVIAGLCTLCLALTVRAEDRNDSRSTSRNDSRSTRNTDDNVPPIPREIGGRTYDQWAKDLKHPDPSVRARAISVIPGFREKAMDLVPLLIERTRDKDASPRVKAVLAFKFMGVHAVHIPDVVKALGERIGSDSQAIVRYEAAQALTRFGPDARAAVVELVKGVGDGSTWELRSACIHVLILAGVDPKAGPDLRVTDSLLLRANSFYEPTRQVRLEAIIALGAMGRPQDPKKYAQVVAALKSQQNFNSADKVIRIWSHVSLMALDDKVNDKYLDTIVKYLKDPERDIREQAVMALGALQERSHDYIPNLCQLLKTEKESPVILAICRSLGRMGDKGDRVLQALIRVTRKDDAESTSAVLAACAALANIGVANAEVMEALNKVLDHKSLDARAKEEVRKDMVDVRKPKDLDKKKPAGKAVLKGEIGNEKDKKRTGR